ncbi:hypothetical protein ACHAXT_000744 [Thalassiosira profunda]
MLRHLRIAALLVALGRAVDAFAAISCCVGRAHHQTELHLKSPSVHHDRRTFLTQQFIAPALASAAAASFIPRPALADALLMDKSSPDIPAFQGGVAEGKKRFQLAIKDIDNLLADYDAISKSGGDNVRLYLGTQGVKSHMYGIGKVLKSLKEEADDIVEYTEALNEFEAYLYQAEGASYQSMFTEHSSAKSTPESLLKTARGDVVNMRKYMGDLAAQLAL